MIPLNVSLSHYKRADIQEEIIANAKDREIAVKYNDNFGKRPDILRNAVDILELAKQGATSFHASEELWRNPLQIDTSMRKHELDNLRKGWDLVLDIDCGIFEYSREAADLVIKALKFHNIKSISCKFSGNKGFHIGVPFEAFPEKMRNDETKKMFPEAPRKIALYIKEMIKQPLGEKIMKFEKNDFNAIIEKTGKNAGEITYYSNKARALNAEPFLNIDTLLISSRHLYRMPYSLHEKSGLVSTPLNPEKVLLFRKEFAIPKNVRISKHRFLAGDNAQNDEGRQLLTQALDFDIRQEADSLREGKELEIPQNALPEELFPPCIKLILDGLEDGRKRALFILVNFFTSIGWDYDMIEKRLREWNAKNREPLREVYLLGQVRYHKQMRKKILPPNCSNEQYMLGIGVCKPDNFCPKIRNPAQYTTKKAWLINRESKGKTKIKAESTKTI
ncbi:hypothetical protein J4480_00375 [Candidatus Woesearchaeota archaeon]|nr:hypothetical protein [Candidatus Woesearchaeota archaeon]